MSPKIPVNEIFGPTVQGEGIHVGRMATFVRVAGCDSKCSWCDTKYAWDAESAKMMTTEEIAESVMRKVTKQELVVLTGGNPCLYDLSELVNILQDNDYEVHLETQGTLLPKWIFEVDFISFSPKPTKQLDKFFVTEMRDMISVLRIMSGQIKFVIGCQKEYDFARYCAESAPDIDFVFQPKYLGGNYNGDLRSLPEYMCHDVKLSSNVRYLPQLHRIIWGDQRGV